jgi:hypothetical protein
MAARLTPNRSATSLIRNMPPAFPMSRSRAATPRTRAAARGSPGASSTREWDSASATAPSELCSASTDAITEISAFRARLWTMLFMRVSKASRMRASASIVVRFCWGRGHPSPPLVNRDLVSTVKCTGIR